MHSVRFILSGRVPASDIMSFLKGPIMRQNLDGLPIWWCPWIHDLALLVTAANRGLLGILSDRVNAKGTECESSLRNGDMTVGILTPADKVFSKKILKNHIRSTFIVGKRSEAAVLPQCYLSGASFVELDDWVQAQSEQFPTAHVLERRIATICANLTKPDYLSKLGIDAADMKDIIYDNVPMLDHGCWPSTAGRGRREEATYVSHRSVFGGKGGTIALSRSLLSVTEQDFS